MFECGSCDLSVWFVLVFCRMPYHKQDNSEEGFVVSGSCIYPLNTVEIEEEVEESRQSRKSLACLHLKSLGRMQYKKHANDERSPLHEFPRKAISSLRWLKSKLMCKRHLNIREIPGSFDRNDSLRMSQTHVEALSQDHVVRSLQ